MSIKPFNTLINPTQILLRYNNVFVDRYGLIFFVDKYVVVTFCIFGVIIIIVEAGIQLVSCLCDIWKLSFI